MYIHINELFPVLNGMIKTDVIDKIPLTADVKNPLRVFTLSCFSNAYLSNLLQKIPNVNGYVQLPDHEQALTALKDAGGVLPFIITLPMGLDFSLKLNKADFDKFYSTIEDKLLETIPDDQHVN